jgi:hypothetical protein
MGLRKRILMNKVTRHATWSTPNMRNIIWMTMDSVAVVVKVTAVRRSSITVFIKRLGIGLAVK